MAMAPYVLVLAETTQAGASYARAARLTRGRHRVVSSASQIRGLRQAQVHILPGFDRRRDKHSILAELRYSKATFFDIGMLELAYSWNDQMPMLEEAYAMNYSQVDEPLSVIPVADGFDEKMSPNDDIPEMSPNDDIPLTTEEPSKPNRRRSKCKKCHLMHYSDEACPVATESMFD